MPFALLVPAVAADAELSVAALGVEGADGVEGLLLVVLWRAPTGDEPLSSR